MDKPQTPTVAPTDPTLDAEAAQAQQAKMMALQSQAQGDTASLMARYGTRLAMSGATSGSPLLMSKAMASPGAV